MRNAANAVIPNNTNHDNVTNGNAIIRPRCDAAARCAGGGGTMGAPMESFIMSPAILATSATGAAVRALWVLALAFLVLWMVDKMKPAAPRRPIPVRVDRTRAPLYREPERPQRIRALANLTGGSMVLGALLAFLVALLAAVALEVAGGLLGN